MNKKKKQKSKTKIDKYTSALNLLFYEGQISWQMNLLFIGLNVGIGTIIGDMLKNINGNPGLILVFSSIGLAINIAWLGTFLRNNKYYRFRMAQARNAEPKNWKLLKEEGYKFSMGKQVIFNEPDIEPEDNVHQFTALERRTSNKFAVQLSIWLFICGFAVLIFMSSFYLIYPYLYQ